MSKLTNSLLILALMVIAVSCGDKNPQPKPRGYFRIDLPEKQYVTLDTMQRYRFEYPAYATITPDYHSLQEKDWVNVEFPRFKGTIHISYKPVDGNLPEYLDDAYVMITKHIGKATGIRDSVIINKDRDVYGLVYFLDGEGVASPLHLDISDDMVRRLEDDILRGRPNKEGYRKYFHSHWKRQMAFGDTPISLVFHKIISYLSHKTKHPAS